MITKDKILTGPNMEEWLRNINLALTQDKVQHAIFSTGPPPLSENPTAAQIIQMDMWNCDYEHARTLVFSSLDDIHKEKFKGMELQSIFLQINKLYRDRTRETRFALNKKTLPYQYGRKPISWGPCPQNDWLDSAIESAWLSHAR